MGLQSPYQCNFDETMKKSADYGLKSTGEGLERVVQFLVGPRLTIQTMGRCSTSCSAATELMSDLQGQLLLFSTFTGL